MYMLSRLLLILSAICLIYSVAILAILVWPASGWVLGLIVVVLILQRKGTQLTTLGSARVANHNDLRRAGMIGANRGLILGRLQSAEPRGTRVRKLFDWRVTAKQACREFWSPKARRDGQLVRLPRAVHTAVFAPSGGGKGVSMIIPFLLTCPEPCVVIDLKGENFLRVAKHRRKVFGHRVVVIDPYRLVTNTPDSINPLDFIRKSSPTALDDVNDLANALVIRNGEEKEPHWNDSAESWISAFLATVVQYG